jgi:hypothetical protein
MKTVSATNQIDAPPLAVWAALTDLDRYPDWNPLFRAATGQVAAGERITLRAVQPGSGRLMTVKARITVADPGAELRWESSLPGVIGGEHSFVLTSVDAGTRLTQAETYRGLLSAAISIPKSETIFQAMNDALKHRVETAA